MDRQRPDGSIERTDPRTGRVRIVSAADAARTALTRERDAELSMQAGAPPIAKGTPPTLPDSAPTSPSAPAAQPGRYNTEDRALNVARAKADGQFDSMRARYNAENKGTQMDEAGTIKPVAGAGTAPKIPEPVAATNPNLPASFDLPMRNVAVAAGPNISTAPNQNPNLAQHGGLPEGSVGYQRKDGRYTVRTADGQTRDFASEAEARANFSTPAAPAPQPAPSVPAAVPPPPTPAQVATAALPAGPVRAGAMRVFDAEQRGLSGVPAAAVQSPAPAPAPAAPTFAQMQSEAVPVSPVSRPATSSAPTFAQMQSEAVPVAPVAPAPVSPAIQAVVAAATQPPQPAPTPTNAPQLPDVRTGAGRLSDVGDAFTAPFKAAGRALNAARITPEQSAKDKAERKDRIKGKTYRPDMRSAPVTIPGSVLNPARDAGSVAPAFDDGEPDAFPVLSGPSGSSRPRASFA